MRAIESGGDVAAFLRMHVGDIGLEFLVDEVSVLARGPFHIHDGGQRVVLHLHQLGSIGGGIHVFGDHGNDGFADIAHPLSRQRRMYGCLQVGERACTRYIAHAGEILRGNDGQHARHISCRRPIDRTDHSMSMR